MLGGYEQCLLERLNSHITYGILVTLCLCRKLNLVLCRLIIGAIGKSFHGGIVFWIYRYDSKLPPSPLEGTNRVPMCFFELIGTP